MELNMDAKPDVAAQLTMLNEQLADLNEQLSHLTEKQRERDLFFAEMQPILKAVMEHATERFQEYEEQGYFNFLRESLRVADRIVESYDEEDVRALGDNIVRIMDTVRAYTQPQVLALANEATEVIDHADELEPTGIFGMVRASRDEDVQKGMAVFLGLLRSVGRGVKAAQDGPKPVKPRKRLPQPAAAPAAPRAARPAAPAAPAAAAAPVVIDGVAFDANGYLADPSQWTKDLAVALAASLGIPELTDAHWKVLETARADYLENGMSPNIRRLTKLGDITTKELYQLFPKAPGMTVARVAGIPKPAGCI
jgi:tRNA 2-thiouridine synthesizing protein E